MKALRFSDARKAIILKQAEDGGPVAEICRKAGISQATCFNGKKKYAGLLASGTGASALDTFLGPRLITSEPEQGSRCEGHG